MAITFDHVVIAPPRGSNPVYFSKDDSEKSQNLNSIVWQSEDPEGFKDDYCFQFTFHVITDTSKNDLIEDPNFQSTVKKIGYWLKYDFIPASLIIGKKTGDTLKLKDGSVVKITCADFNFLHHNLGLAAENIQAESEGDVAKAERLGKRLGELKELITQHYGAFQSEMSAADKKLLKDPNIVEPGFFENLFSCIKTAFFVIAVLFVRLVTCNWSENTCLHNNNNSGFISLQF